MLRLLLIIVLTIALTLAAIAILPWQRLLQLPATAPMPAPIAAGQGNFVELSNNANLATSEIDQLERDITASLKRDFSDQAHSIVFQVSLKPLRDDLVQSFSEQGLKLFQRIIRNAFPNFADDIFAAIANMDLYDNWLLDNAFEHNNMNALAYRGALWGKRRDLFGDAAELIWSTELSDEQERIENMQKTVALLDQSQNTSLDEKLLLLKDSFERNFAATPQGIALDSRGVMAQVFFGFGSVQEELAKIPTEQRQEKIDEFRRAMGYDETSVKSLAERDQSNESRWQNGYNYMEARNQIIQETQGADLQIALDELRTEFFGDEAYTIKREEEDLELFRYERPRVYGRN